MREAIEKARQRLEELDSLLADQKVLSDRNLLLKYGKERSALEPLVAKAGEFEQVEKDIRGAREIIQTSDEKELIELAETELETLTESKDKIEHELKELLLPKDPSDEKNTIVEIRAGTGGEEAALFAADLLRMYSRYAEGRRWKVDILWEGIMLKDLLAHAQVSSEANTVIFYAYDDYNTSLPLEYIIENDILMAYKMNNVTLPPERGYPFQLVAESKYGYKWIKWITEIELSDNEDFRGFWESRGYSNNADVR